MTKKLCDGKKPMLLLAMSAMLLLLVASVGAVAADNYDNFEDLWESTIGQYEKLFPAPEMLYIFLLLVLTVGVYIRTNSVGAVTAFLAIGGMLLAGGVGDLGRLTFGFVIIISFAFLIWMAYRRR